MLERTKVFDRPSVFYFTQNDTGLDQTNNLLKPSLQAFLQQSLMSKENKVNI